MSTTTEGTIKTSQALDTGKSALKGVSSAVKQGVTTVTEAMTPAEKGFVPNLVNIVGEEVSLTPSGLSPQETVIVEFDDYYVPPELKKRPEEVTILKNTMRTLFSNLPKEITNSSGEPLPKTETSPYPPCGEYEKLLVLGSLLYRTRLLRGQLYREGILNQQQLAQRIADLDQGGREKSIQGPDRAITRTHLEHLARLQDFIEKYDSEQKCIDLGEIAYKDIDLDMSDDRIKELLKQFVFFILQSKYPLKEFRTTDPSAPQFVKRLQKKRIPFDDKYMPAYTASGNQIPEPIAKVLDSIRGNDELLQREILSKIKEEKKKLIESIASKLPDNDPLLKTLRDTEDPGLVFDRIQSQINEFKNSFGPLQREKDALSKKVNDCEISKGLLERRIQELERQVNDAELKCKGKENCEEQLNQLREAHTAELSKLTERITGLTNEATRLTQEAQAKDAEIAALTKRNQELEVDVEMATIENDFLSSLKADAERDVAALRSEYEARLADQTRRAEQAERAKATAEESLAQSQRDHHEAEGGLAAATERVIELEGELGVLNGRIAEVEAAKTTAEAALNEKTEELSTVQVRIGELNGQITDLGDQIIDLSEQIVEKDTKLEEKKGLEDELESIQEELAKAQAALRDCTTEKDGLTKQVEALSSTASTDKTQLGELTKQLEIATAEKSEADATVARLTAELQVTKDQLAVATTEGKAKNVKIQEQGVALQGATAESKRLRNAVEASKVESTEMKSISKKLEENLQASEQKVSGLLTQHQADLKAQEAKLKGEYGRELDSLQSLYAEKSAQHHEDAENRIRQLTNDFQDGIQLGSQYEGLRTAVEEISKSITTGSPITLDTSSAPQREALDTIVNKLKGTAQSLRLDSSLNHCYLVFVTSFMFQISFITKSPDRSYVIGGDDHASMIYTILNTVFSGETLQVRTKGLLGSTVEEAKEVKLGLYKDFGCGPKKDASAPAVLKSEQTLCKCTGGEGSSDCQLVYGMQETTTIKNYLDFFGKLLAAMTEQKDISVGYTATEASYKDVYNAKFYHFMKKFEEKLLKTVLAKRDDLLLTSSERQVLGTKQEKEKSAYFLDLFASRCTSHFTENFKLKQEGFLFKKYVKTESNNVIVIKTDINDSRTRIQQSVNYSILFFGYILLLRDYLTHVEQTSSVCKIPEILKIQKASP